VSGAAVNDPTLVFLQQAGKFQTLGRQVKKVATHLQNLLGSCLEQVREMW